MSNLRENKMGIMPVNKLLITMSLPMMASMLIQALYNIIDSIFVAAISEEALTALSLAFPVQNLMIGVATGTGVGMNAMLSKCLGEKNLDKVTKASRNGVFLVFAASVAFMIFGIFGSRFFFEIQTDNAEIIEYGTQYVYICTIASVFCFLSIIFERLMQATGRTVLSMYTQGVGAIVNIILDPIFIFVFDMDVVGAALATIIGQACSCVTGFVLNQKFNPEVRLSFKGFRPHLATIKRIYSVGVPSMLMMGIGSVTNFTLNNLLIKYFTTTAAAILGAYYKLQSFCFMPLFGMNNGVIPIIAFNYGAGKRSRIIKCIKCSVFYAIAIMLTAMAVFQLIPAQLLCLFDASEQMLQMGVPAFRIISTHYVLAGFCIAIGSVFQAFGKGLLSMIMSLCRQIFALIPAAFLLAHYTRNLNLFWLCFPIAEVVSATVCAISLVSVYKNIIKKIPDNS